MTLVLRRQTLVMSNGATVEAVVSTKIASAESLVSRFISHVVTLPHPPKDGGTVTGKCSEGDWEIDYSYGEHGDAVSAGVDHIQRTDESDADESQTLDGTITVYPTVSL